LRIVIANFSHAPNSNRGDRPSQEDRGLDGAREAGRMKRGSACVAQRAEVAVADLEARDASANRKSYAGVRRLVDRGRAAPTCVLSFAASK
jgi:hypothetical protein